MRRLDWLAIFLLVGGVLVSSLVQTETKTPDDANPRRPATIHFSPIIWGDETKDWLRTGPTEQKSPLFADQLPSGDSIIKDEGVQKSSVGTAFSVSPNGLWLTAKHVANGCSITAIQAAQNKYVKVHSVTLHPNADVALLQTNDTPHPLSLAREFGKTINGYNIGFPTGQPGAIHTRFIGEMSVRHTNRNDRSKSYRERVNAWVEQSRIPDFKGSIGGISGGAVIGDDGSVVGIVQAGSTRRARVVTARPSTIEEMFRIAKIEFPASKPNPADVSISKDNYPNIARNLLTSLRVAKVFCIIK
jgi:serine protease Do